MVQYNSSGCNMAAPDTGYTYRPMLTTSNSYCQSPVYEYDSRQSTVCKRAVLKKVKTNKSKFFVLHKSSTSSPARLEYFDSESQWNKHKKPRRTIYLKSCFSINPYADSRVKFGLTLFTKDDSFQIGFGTEQDRDMWLADMCYLSRTSCEQTKDPVELEWQVCVSTRNMGCPLCGCYSLLLTECQATLLKKGDPDGALLFPWDVIVRCDKRDKYFVMEVSELSSTGAGEILMQCDDSLIAQNVHQAFVQNMTAAGEGNFRPVSKSLSYKDRKSAFSLRLRSGSDAKIKAGSGLVKMGLKHSSMMSSANSLGYHRERSDSMDSHSTTCSMSTEESSDHGRTNSTGSRAVTPDHRSGSVSSKSRVSFLHYKCQSADQAYTDMTCNQSQDGNSNFVYVDMTPGLFSHNHPEININKIPANSETSGYLDMTCGSRVGTPSPKSFLLRPEQAKSYLVDDEEASKSPPLQRSSVPDDYVEMSRQNLNGRDKSSSAPHLSPLVLGSYRSYDETDNQSKVSNSMSSHRPRGSSWSQQTRPQLTSAHRLRSNSAKYKGNMNNCSDYIDMTCGGKKSGVKVMDCYVEMSLNRNSGRAEDKENWSPQSGTQLSAMITEPFPELSASSEDDVSLHSIEGSMSVNSLTSSTDSMSMSSHSSQYGGSTEPEPYVSMHPSVICVGKPMPTPARHLLKLPKVQSFIKEDGIEHSS